MSPFPKNSPFYDPLDLGPLDPVPSPSRRVTKLPDATEVPFSVLERWYAALNELITDPPLRTSAHREGFEELRDEIYSYLRG